MAAVVRFTLARVVLFVLALGLLWVLQLRGFWLLGGAVLLSGVASYVLLSRQRDAVSRFLSRRIERSRRRIEEGASSEDDD